MQLSMLPGRGSADFSDLTESTGLCSIQRHGGQVIDDFVPVPYCGFFLLYLVLTFLTNRRKM